MIAKLLKPIIFGLGKRRLPKVSGALNIPGLQAKVEVIRDKWGVPHIYAQNMDDMAIAQGFVHAQDRLWQMELNRRVALGKVSEIFGEIGLDTDRTVRTFGFHRIAQEDWKLADDEIKRLLTKYVSGINAFLEHKSSKMPIEFSLVGVKPAKWEVSHLLAFSRLMSWQMCFAWQGEIIRSRLIDAVGQDLADEIDPRYRKENPIGLPKGIEVNRILDDGRLEALNGPFIQEVKGSNAWAISKEKSVTGAPFLCNDPHLPMTLPSIWYENHLNVGDDHVTGVTVPGLPQVLIGHNDNIAWGMTLAYTDIQDLYVEKFKDDNCLEYEYKGQWEKSTIIEEEIKVKGRKETHVEKVVVTRHGPVISDVANYNDRKVAIKSMCLEPGQLMRGWFNLNQAKGWDDFAGAIKYVESPALNVTYADVHGNIGYYMSGKVPVRAGGKGKLPAEGWTGENEWTGYVPFEEMPHALNPEKGHVVSCNHKVVDDNFPHYLGESWMNGYRAARLEELFSEKRKFGPEDFKKYHLDYQSMVARDFKKHFDGLKSDNEKVSWAISQLQNWDGSLEAKSLGGLLFEIVRDRMAKNLLEKPLQKELTELYRGKPFRHIVSGISEFYGHDTTMMLRVLDDPNSWWMQQAEGKEKLILQSIEDAMGIIEEKLGSDRTQWRWGRMHQLVFPHALGAQKPLDKIFNIGPFEMGGDTDTVHQTAIHYNEGFESGNLVCASWRQIVDMGDLAKSECILPPGNSGQPGSPNYGDQAEMWYKGEYRSMLWTREQVEKEEKYRLILES